MFHADRALRHSAFGLLWSLEIGHLSFALILALVLSGCTSHERPHAKLPPSKYTALPAKQLPAFMKGTILEAAEIQNNEPYLVSGYGLVVGLANTGDNRGTRAGTRARHAGSTSREGGAHCLRHAPLPPRRRRVLVSRRNVQPRHGNTSR